MKTFVLLMILIELLGCARVQQFPTDSGNVASASRMYGFTKRSDAQLVVMYESIDVACMLRISIDGKPAADMEVGESAQFGMTIGAHRLVALPLDGCANRQIQEAKINVKAGDAILRRVDDHTFAPMGTE